MRDQERRRLVELAELGGGQDQVHAGQRAGPRRVDRDDARVARAGERRHGGVEDPAGLDVVDERPQPPQEPRILVSRDARTDQARRHRSGRTCVATARDLSMRPDAPQGVRSRAAGPARDAVETARRLSARRPAAGGPGAVPCPTSSPATSSSGSAAICRLNASMADAARIGLVVDPPTPGAEHVVGHEETALREQRLEMRPVRGVLGLVGVEEARSPPTGRRAPPRASGARPARDRPRRARDRRFPRGPGSAVPPRRRADPARW